VTHCEDWQDLVEYIAYEVWQRMPEVDALEDPFMDAHEMVDERLIHIARVRALALRTGASIGVALTRITPRVPEDLLNLIRLATVYAQIEVYDTPAIRDRAD
jgi:hypothetical protein